MLKKIKEAADQIPSMGGREMGEAYDRYISQMRDGLDVVEIGAWLGAGTAQLAMSMYKHKKSTSFLHVYDRFTASASEVKKASDPAHYKWFKGFAVDKKGKRIGLIEGQNTVPVVQNNLRVFKGLVKILYHRQDVVKIRHRGLIGVMVLDAAKKSGDFKKLMKRIETKFFPGETIVFFMDYYYYLYKTDKDLEYQRKYVEGCGKYTLLESHKELCCAIARYDGKSQN